MISDPNALQMRLADLVRRRLHEGVGKIGVEPSLAHDGDEFLLVTIEMKDVTTTDEVLESLIEEIEAEIAKADERYPSVRFLDAA